MNRQGFGLWLTGIPASGKSSITRELAGALRSRGISVVVLESDEMRKILTPRPTYREEERDDFYRALAQIGVLITRNGINVIFDATANKRAYRNQARELIERFAEIYVECPLVVCTNRDPKGIYAKGVAQQSAGVPGLQATYEPPLTPEITVDGQVPPPTNAARILDNLKRILYI
jgi:adenylylsulfate kinase